MSYIPLTEYSKAWIFRHKDLPVAADDLALIKPMSPHRASQLWQTQISTQSEHYSEFHKGDWAYDTTTWLESADWQKRWESDENDLPELLATHLQWEDNTVVYFCYESDHVIETTWHLFKKYWKNFLFMDDGPILVARKRKQVAQFFDNGQVQIGLKP